MELTTSELEALNSIAENNEKAANLAKALGKSKAQTYRIIKSLEKKDFIEFSKAKIHPKKQTHITLLLQILKNNEEMRKLLAYSGIKILEALLTPKAICQIIKETGLKKAEIYKKLNRAWLISAVRKNGRYYKINTLVWPKLEEFLTEFFKYEQTIDARIPAEALIYLKNNKEVLYSSINEQDAAKTSFSVFGEYGIKLLGNETFYYLPKRKLSKKEIFIHSLIICEKRKEVRFFIYSSLFYLKFKNELKRIKNPVLSNIKSILSGKSVDGYPSLYEIKEKAELYDIRI
jgi:DNA-binding MarR family transcriptional regulator